MNLGMLKLRADSSRHFVFPFAGSTTRNGVQNENDVEGYIDIIERVCFGKQLKPKALYASGSIKNN